MKTRSLFLALVLAATATSAFGAKAPKSAPPPAIDIPYEKFVLDNGLTLIVHEDHKAPVVAVNVWYHVGSKDERPGRTGFAHLFEHLMFNGSENHNDEWFRPLESAGATKLNGTTWYDRTNYFQNVPTSALDMVLWMESDRMGHLLGAIDQAKLDEQRGVVQNEKRQGQNRPYGKVSELITQSTWPANHPYSWESIGSMEDLNAASLDDVKEWFRTYYGAANAVLVVAGDVTPAEVREKVQKYFGDVGAGPVIKRQQEWVPKLQGTHRATLQDRVPQARIYKVWNVPGYKQRDYTLWQLAANVLAGGKNSRLYKRLVYTDQTATSVNAFIGPFELASQVQIVATVKPGGDAAAVERALDEEIARFIANGPTAEELERVQTANYAAAVRGLERLDGFGGKSAVLAESQVYGGSPDFHKQRFNWSQGATVADVAGVARRWLTDGVFVLNVEPTPEFRVAKTGADRSKVPGTGTPPALKLPPPVRATLANGLKLVLVERHNAPVLDLTLIVDAGFAADSLARPGTAQLATFMLQEGTKTLDSLAIAARAESLGAQFTVGSTLDTSYLGMNLLSSKLESSLDLYTDVLLNPTFPARELERLRGQLLAGISQEKTQPQGIGRRLLPALIYGAGHAYANPLSGSGNEESVKAMTREDLAKFHAQWVRPDNATLLVVGDTTLAALVPQLEKRLATWRAPAEPIARKNVASVAAQPKPRVFLVNRTGAEQSYIVAGSAGPTRGDPQNIAQVALNTVLGGNFISRLNMNLREEKHWSYGAGSGLVEAIGPGLFTAAASVQTDKTAESMREILKELRDVLTTRKVSDAELKFARDSLVLALPGSNETSGEVAGSYADIVTFGLKDSYWNDFVGEVSSLTPASVAAAAPSLVKPDSLTWIVVGDLLKIEAGVRALNLGEVTVLDADGKPVAK
jgi:zinc protease